MHRWKPVFPCSTKLRWTAQNSRTSNATDAQYLFRMCSCIRSNWLKTANVTRHRPHQFTSHSCPLQLTIKGDLRFALLFRPQPSAFAIPPRKSLAGECALQNASISGNVATNSRHAACSARGLQNLRRLQLPNRNVRNNNPVPRMRQMGNDHQPRSSWPAGAFPLLKEKLRPHVPSG